MMATFAHYVICVLSLLLLPGGWARDEPECCPGQDQYLVYDRETNVTECHIRATNRTIGPPFLPDCETEVKLVLDQPDPSLLAITPRCRDELLEEDGTFVNAFLFCPSSGFGTDPPDLEQGGSKILVRKCCPLEEGYDLRQQECVPRPFSWWLPVLHPETREVRNLSSDNYQLNIDDLSSIPCAKYMLTPKKDPRETYHVLRNTGHLYIQALNSTYSPEEFCLDHGRIDNESWIDLARICHPKEKKILADCKGKVCVQKCCVQTDYLHESGVGPPRCSPAERLWDSKKIFHSHPPAEEVHVITNFPLCPGMTGRGIPLRPTNNPKDKFYLTESGGLMVEKYKMVVDVPRYCVDDIGASSGTLDPIAIVCFPEGSNVKDKAREVIYIIYSVLLVLSATFLLLTFLLYLILPERKSLHGKTLLCYVGCLLVASIALSVAQIGSDNGISNSVCLAAALVTFFFYLSAFFWLNVMSFDIWWNLSDLKTHSRGRGHERKKLIRYSLYAFGVPACIVLIACVVEFAPNIPPHIIKPGFDPAKRCWLYDHAGTILYFYGPIALLLVANAIFFALTSRYLIQHAKDTAHLTRSQDQKQKFLVYIKLFVVMGVSWLMEVISFLLEEPKEAFILTDIINILQGVFIFLIFICKKKTIKFLKKKAGDWFSRHDSIEKMSMGTTKFGTGRGHPHFDSKSTAESKGPDHDVSEAYTSTLDNSEVSEVGPGGKKRTTNRSDSSRTKSTDISETST